MYTKHNIQKVNINKIFVFIFIFINHQFLKAGANDLEKPITISLDTTIYSALNIIGDSIGYYFSYNSELFDAEERTRIQLENVPVKQALDSIFKGKYMDYQIIGNQIVISKKKRAPVDLFYIEKTYNIRSISGAIKEKESGEAIPFSSIGIIGKNNWTVSNLAGDFVLKIDSPKYEDTLHFSCLGYKSVRISLYDYLDKETNEILLEIDYISIQEVVIRKINPVTLIKQAIENIKDNYPDKPFDFTGFYREIILKNNNYVSITEAVVDGYKSSYTNKNQTDQIRIIKGRKIIDLQKNDTILVKLQAGMYNSMLLDVIKNPSDFLNFEYFSDYEYSIGEMILANNNYVYEIKFNQKGKSPFALYQGKMYIDYKNAAILNVEFNLNQNGIKNASNLFIIKKPAGLKIFTTGARYIVNYALGEDSIYCINYIRSETSFKIKTHKKLFYTNYDVISEIAFTSASMENVSRISKDEIAKRQDIFTEKVTTYDPSFWKDYSHIPPEKSLLNAIKEAKARKR